MLNGLEKIVSVINDSYNAKDTNKAFTFIEFIKEYGFENEQYSFLTLYKEYLSKYAKKQNDILDSNISDYVHRQMVEILKTITLTYSSYDEQRFIKNLDWADDEAIKTLIPFYARKIQEICKFYRRKRSEISLIVKKNASKGSKKSIEQIIYDKIVDFMFNNKENLPQISDLQRDLTISIENYVDIYSDYFDIPRDEKLQDTKRIMLNANMNDIDYRVYLDVEQVISNLLYNGKVYLKEIPFIADLALDLSQDCVGDLAKLRDELVEGATVNRISLTEQIALKRRLYEKYLGCDLYYIYCDSNKNYTMDVLVKAKNPSANLLNGPNPDTVTTEGGDYKLLSKIGLFFKPEKLSFLKINSKNFEWNVDKDNLKEDTVYIFPDPSKYGDIGNNKTETYPLIIRHNLNYEIKNLSLGKSKNDPLILLGEVGWNSYYSKQQDDFKIKKNDKYQYAFSFLANHGLLHSYQRDIFGNEFGIFKGYNKEEIKDDNGNIIKEIITISNNAYNTINTSNDIVDEIDDEDLDDSKHSEAMIINGGYFKSPEPDKKNVDFDYSIDKIIFNDVVDSYRWSGITTISKWNIFEDVINYIDFGTFKTGEDIKYIDHYGAYSNDFFINDNITITTDENIEEVINNKLLSVINSSSNVDTKIILKKYTSEELDNQSGNLYIKDISSYDAHPISIFDKFSWLKSFEQEKIISYSLIANVLILNTTNKFIITKYDYNGIDFSNAYPHKGVYIIEKENNICSESLYVEKENKVYFLLMKKIESFKSFNFDNVKIKQPSLNILPQIYRIGIDEFEMENILKYNNFNDNNFELPYSEKIDINKIIFSYNNNLKLFLIAYLYKNFLKTPHLYEHIFKLEKNENFEETLESCIYKTSSIEVNDSDNESDKIYIYNSRPREITEATNADDIIIWCSDEKLEYSKKPFFISNAKQITE